MVDMTCLAEGQVFPADFDSVGINLNEIVVGPTGCGKSYSNAYPRLVHTHNCSVVVPISKRALKEKFKGMFEKRGYEVWDLDFSHPENCQIGYDPMDYISSDEDVIRVARNFIGGGISKSRNGDLDPYWNDSATSVLAAEMALIRLNAKSGRKKPCFSDVVDLHRSIKIDNSDGSFKSNIDILFEKAEKRYPGNQATELWKTIQNLASKTASCIFSIVNGAMDKIFTESVLAMTKKKERVSFRELGEKKVALFITTSPMNKSLQNLVNIMYADMFKELFDRAESNESCRLDVPVHIICDDFACGGRIVDFEEYISIFRAAGISVTMLLQSESQLSSMYGEQAATTIINNCDTYVYMGGMDIQTCKHISVRMNKPVDKVMSLPLEKVVVFRRGASPVVARRYQILEDPEYKKAVDSQMDSDR